jgi:acetyl-CoA synthetase (ADP-forming)
MGRLSEEEAVALLRKYGVPTVEGEVAGTEEEAVGAAERLGYPVVLKIVSPDILHKTDAGGVLLGVEDEEEVRSGYREVVEKAKRYKPEARIQGVLVQKQAPRGREVIVGGLRDPQFDGVVMFGLGGVFVEVLRDVSFRIAPIGEEEALSMIEEIKGYPLLTGFRGEEKADLKAIARIISAVSEMIMRERDIREMDINPLLVYPRGALAVDVRIIKGE